MKNASKHGIQLPRLPKGLAPLTNTHLEDEGQIVEGVLDGIDLSGGKAAGVVIETALLRRCLFTQAKLDGLRAIDARFERCELSGMRCEHGHFRRVTFEGCRMLGIDAAEAGLEDATFSGCSAEGALFSQAGFKSARFEKCDFRRASFEGADLSGVVFHECNLTQADLRGAILTGADFRTATLDGAQAGIKELQGSIIAPFQAAQIVALLGIIVREVDDAEGLPASTETSENR